MKSHILDSIKIDTLTEEWYYLKVSFIRMRRNGDDIEFAQVGYYNDGEMNR